MKFSASGKKRRFRNENWKGRLGVDLCIIAALLFACRREGGHGIEYKLAKNLRKF